jgi:hypothetical protein
MTTFAAPATTDQSGFRHVVRSGAKVGLVTAAGVILFLVLNRYLPEVGTFREAVLALVVLAAAVPIALLPGHLVGARSVEGVAGAAAVGLLGTVAFMVVDIVVLRTVKAYPWTWDAIGGGSTWWYLPVWWMLGTFAAWMGGLVIADRYTPGTPTLAALALPPLLGGIVAAVAVLVTGVGVVLPVAAGAGFLITLTGMAVVGLATRRN